MSPQQFALVWDILTPSVGEIIPDGQNPFPLVDPVAGNFAELELQAFKVSDGAMLATSVRDGWIDGYVVFFDPDSFEAIKTLVLVGLTLGEPTISGPVVDAIYQGDPTQPSDVPIAFSGDNHQIEILRTGADPVNDPLWILTVAPDGSAIDHNRLRLAAAEAASVTF